MSILLWAGLAGAQQPVAPDTAMQQVVQQVRQVLVSPREQAFAQVLVSAEVLRDPRDTSFYDIVVRFDPERYRDPHLGRYPLTFEDQCVLWGKRLALYSRIASWKAGRFYLHDLYTGRQVWVDLATARLLSPPYGKPPAAKTFAAWLPYIHNTPRSTEPRALGTWLRLMREESRDLVIYQWRAAAGDTALPADSLRGR
ncbi:MAG: hypothetical protein HYW07_02395 [Candidatus Latescibacteria bacterium]|nr:hypothetical protein [Candidatus Latescibacterota bacterium]